MNIYTSMIVRGEKERKREKEKIKVNLLKKRHNIGVKKAHRNEPMIR